MVDYYRVLGLPPTPTLEQIKAAYRRRALRHHPDRNPGSSEAEELFKRCSEAYSTLTDPEKRSSYDARLLASRGPRDLVQGVLEELLGGGYRRRQRGYDLSHTMTLTLEQIARPIRHELALLVDDVCSDCAGRGSAAGGEETCPSCQGRGMPGRNGWLALPRTCGRCGGRGRRITVPCPVCDGVGMLERTQKVVVALESPVQDGHVEILRGRGHPGMHGGEAGDLHVLVRVAPHPLFRQVRDQLELEAPISFAGATFGTTLVVPTLEGRVQMKVPAGTQSGTVFRIRGRGMPRAGKRGDLLVKTIVETPIGLDADQAEALRRFERGLPRHACPLQAGFAALVADRTRDQEEAGSSAVASAQATLAGGGLRLELREAGHPAPAAVGSGGTPASLPGVGERSTDVEESTR